MKIIIYVDFSNGEFNKDFSPSNRLTSEEHTVLLVTTDGQLNASIGAYDLVLSGFSCKKDLSYLDKPTYSIKKEEDLQGLSEILKG